MTDKLIEEIARAICQDRAHRYYGEQFTAAWDAATDEEREPWLADATAAYTVLKPHIKALVDALIPFAELAGDADMGINMHDPISRWITVANLHDAKNAVAALTNQDTAA